MKNLAGEAEKGGLKFDFDGKLRLEFRGSKVHLSDNNPDDDKVLELRYMRKPD